MFDLESDKRLPEFESTDFLNFFSPLRHEASSELHNVWCREIYRKFPDEKYFKNDPSIIAQIMFKFFSIRGPSQVKVLDASAGVGRVGDELYKRGFRLIDGIDPTNNETLMKKHSEGKYYQNVFRTSIGLGRIQNIETNRYDAAVIYGEIPSESSFYYFTIAEMIRVVSNAGGIVFLILLEKNLQGEEEYMKDLTAQGVWTLVSRIVVFDRQCQSNKIVFVFEVIVDEINSKNTSDSPAGK